MSSKNFTRALPPRRGDFYPAMSALAEVLRRLLKERNLSAREVSLKAGLNESAIKNILGGKSRSPRLDTINKLAIALGVPASLLLAADAGNPEGEDEINLLRWYRRSSRENQRAILSLSRSAAGEDSDPDSRTVALPMTYPAPEARPSSGLAEPRQQPLRRRPPGSTLHEDPSDFDGPKG